MSRAIFRRSLAAARSKHGTRSRVVGIAAPALVLLVLAACTAGPLAGESSSAVGPSGPAGAGGPDLAAQRACRSRVNEMYEVRNRADSYPANPSVNSPFSANFQAGITSRGLPDQFEYDRSVAECERASASGAAGPAFPPPPPSRPGR